MKRWLGLFAILGVMAAAAIFVSLYLRTLTPEGQYRQFSERCDRVRIGMTQAEVEDVFGERLSGRTAVGSIIGSGPYAITVPFSPTGPGDTRYFEVTFVNGVVTEKGMRIIDKHGRLSDPPGQ